MGGTVGKPPVAGRRRAVGAVMFFPRGGSAHAARAIAAELPAHGWDYTLLAGSRSDLGAAADAHRFYAGLDLVSLEMTPGGDRGRGGRTGAPIGRRAPMHPSFEDRPGAPDRVFAVLDDDEYELHVEAWSAALLGAGAPAADVLHLHHLTPLNEAAARVAPGVPVVGQLHGTELRMLEWIEAGPPPTWHQASAWRERMLEWATRCARVIVAPGAVERTVAVLGIDRDLIIPLANGFDPRHFRPLKIDRRAFWHRQLVEEPRGWRPGGDPGGVRYAAAEIAPLVDGTVFIYVGRFTETKRLPMLIRAFERARRSIPEPIALVLVGGHPGEWEGVHPVEAIAAAEARDVFLAGWHGQRDLPQFFAASDAVVLASEREQFGQVLVEGMACGLPAVAAASLGPRAIVDHGRTGWLFPVDDEDRLVAALREAAADRSERERRGALARAEVISLYTWPAIVERLAGELELAAETSRRRAAARASTDPASETCR